MTDIVSGSILSRLRTECFFPTAISETEDVPGSIFPVLKHKIGHIRADYDGYRWWNTPWPLHRELETPEICAEIDKVYEALTGKTAFCDLTALTSFCKAHPDACVGSEYRDEYNFYFEGERCNYWLRLITREKGYNLYLNAFVKGNLERIGTTLMKELNKSLITEILLNGNSMKCGETVTFRYRDWVLTLRREEPNYEPYRYALKGIRDGKSLAGTYETWSRRYQSIDSALLHILNRFNECVDIKDRFSTLSEVLKSLE